MTLLVLPGTTGTVLLAAQAVVFAIGAFVGLQAQPYGLLFRAFVRPRLGAPRELEAVEPPTFAQLVGFLFTAVALAAIALGSNAVATGAVALALGAAFLNAAFGICLGCEMYVIGQRLRNR